MTKKGLSKYGYVASNDLAKVADSQKSLIVCIEFLKRNSVMFESFNEI